MLFQDMKLQEEYLVRTCSGCLGVVPWSGWGEGVGINSFCTIWEAQARSEPVMWPAL